MNCPECSSGSARVVDTRLLLNGRKRRLLCRNCGHRWTTHEPASADEPVRARRTLCRRGRSLTAEEVRLILLAPLTVSNATLGRELEVSRELVRQVRNGYIHAKIHPEIARPGGRGRSCHGCQNWSTSGCSYGFPEPNDEGPSFARDCDLYEELQ